MNAELVSIGSELLLGHIVDSNAAFLARELNTLGVGVRYKTVVGDNPERMHEVLTRAVGRSDIVITSGGLGPTEDDITREIVAQVMGVDLEFHQDLYDHIRQLFEGIGRPMTDNNARQAYAPAGAEIIQNPNGTAPTFMAVSADGHRVFCLPGVPRELEWLMRNEVMPRVRELTGTGTIKSRTLLICGMGESRVDMQVGDLLREASNPTLGILAHQFITALRITARAETEAAADEMIAEMEADLRQRFGKQIFGTDDDTLEGVVCALLTQYDATVAVAESLSGGALARRLTSTGQPCFVGGAVLPTSGAVAAFLGGTPPDDPEAEAAALAERARDVHGAAVGMGITGRAPAQPGTDSAFGGGHTAVALAMPDDTPQTWAFPFGGRTAVQQDRIAVLALECVRRNLAGVGAL